MVVCGLLIAAPAAGASVTATEEVTEGTLEFINSTPANITFPATTLNGTNQTASRAQAFDVADARGTGAGWSITATSTTFKSASHTLSTTATTIASAPADACDAGATCTLASTNVSYPYTLPAAEPAPTATKLFNATENAGLGDQTVTPTWSLAIPANTYKGTYTSTWTLTLASTP
jgi:WxL domain surface cell wall-binding